MVPRLSVRAVQERDQGLIIATSLVRGLVVYVTLSVVKEPLQQAAALALLPELYIMSSTTD